MARHKCAVIIPTKNALPDFRRVLNKVLAQKTGWSFEIIVIDSGSTDGTVELVRSLPEVRLIEIAPSTFGHGRTRNQAIAASDAEFVALLTHDAEPYDDNWLKNLVITAEKDERIAGVFGRHVAYDTASPFTKFDLDQHFEVFMNSPQVVSRELNSERYERETDWRQFLHFYSDNNSLLRKSVWEKLPYPDVEFAEDQLWAKLIIEEGHYKAYAPTATVYHSHDYGVLEQLQRAFDESRNFKKYFGYELSNAAVPALLTMFRYTVQAFSQVLDTEQYGPVTLKHRSHRAAMRIALVLGHFLGTNHERLPNSWATKLSLDNKLFES